MLESVLGEGNLSLDRFLRVFGIVLASDDTFSAKSFQIIIYYIKVSKTLTQSSLPMSQGIFWAAMLASSGPNENLSSEAPKSVLGQILGNIDFHDFFKSSARKNIRNLFWYHFQPTDSGPRKKIGVSRSHFLGTNSGFQCARENLSWGAKICPRTDFRPWFFPEDNFSAWRKISQ